MDTTRMREDAHVKGIKHLLFIKKRILHVRHSCFEYIRYCLYTLNLQQCNFSRQNDRSPWKFDEKRCTTWAFWIKTKMMNCTILL